MRNNKNSQSAVLERMGSDTAISEAGRSAIAHQLCAVVEGNFRSILFRAKIVRLLINFAEVLLFGVELAFGVHSLLTLVVRHTSSAWWLAKGYK